MKYKVQIQQFEGDWQDYRVEIEDRNSALWLARHIADSQNVNACIVGYDENGKNWKRHANSHPKRNEGLKV